MTASIVDLNKDESWFWNSEPRIVINLINEKKEIDMEKMKAQSIFIAYSVWGKNPDDLTKKKEILGIDKPVDPSMLRGWL